jgi:hypothetical protein
MAHKPMTETLASEERDHSNRRPQGISRREFIKLAAVVGLPSAALAALAGCGPTQQAVVTSTAASTVRPQPTLTPTPIPPPSVTARRPKVIKIYPKVPSRVVHTHHAGVWEGENLAPAVIWQMLDASIVALTSYQQLPDADLQVLAQTVSTRLLGAGPGDGWLPGMVRGRR